MSDVFLQVRLRLPTMPNYIRLAQGCGDGAGFDVKDMDDQEVSRFCEAWTAAFKEHVKNRRKED